VDANHDIGVSHEPDGLQRRQGPEINRCDAVSRAKESSHRLDPSCLVSHDAFRRRNRAVLAAVGLPRRPKDLNGSVVIVIFGVVWAFLWVDGSRVRGLVRWVLHSIQPLPFDPLYDRLEEKTFAMMVCPAASKSPRIGLVLRDVEFRAFRIDHGQPRIRRLDEITEPIACCFWWCC